MAQKRSTKKKASRRRPTTKVTEAKAPKKKVAKKRTTKSTKATKQAELRVKEMTVATLIPSRKRNSLIEWFNLYLSIEGKAGADNTFQAKRRDLEVFVSFLQESAGTDHPDQWTRSLTRDFLKHLDGKKKKSPTTINRMLATLRHSSTWIESQRPFLAGLPCDRIDELKLEDPEWKGLEDIQITRLKSAAEQLIHIQTRANQHPVRNYAIFLVLLQTGLRISELLALEMSQYDGKHFKNVKRKGKAVSRKVFIAKEAREALDRYIVEDRGKKAGVVFCSKSGRVLPRQSVDDALKTIAGQANANLTEKDQIRFSAHVLRHTFLRKVARKHGVEYAKELAGHTSNRYIWRYVQPTDSEKEGAIEGLF